MCLCQADLLKSKLANKGCCQGKVTCSRPKISSQSCKSRSPNFSLFCKLHSCQQSCLCSWTKWAWTIWLCLEIFLPCKCSNCIQVKPIVSNYAPQPKNHWRFSPIGIVQPEVSWISSFLKYRCLLPYAYLDDSRKYYLANSKNLTKKLRLRVSVQVQRGRTVRVKKPWRVLGFSTALD